MASAGTGPRASPRRRDNMNPTTARACSHRLIPSSGTAAGSNYCGGWIYRFEAYVPASKRLRGYYALPLLWCDQVIGWANAMLQDGRLVVKPGYVGGRVLHDARFRIALHHEVARMAAFLGLSDSAVSEPARLTEEAVSSESRKMTTLALGRALARV